MYRSLPGRHGHKKSFVTAGKAECVSLLLTEVPRQTGDAATHCPRLPSALRALGYAGRCFEKGQLHEAVGWGVVEQGPALLRGGFAHCVSVLSVNGESLL